MSLISNAILFNTTFSFFFFNDTATTEIYTLSLHDALPILPWWSRLARSARRHMACRVARFESGRGRRIGPAGGCPVDDGASPRRDDWRVISTATSRVTSA